MSDTHVIASEYEPTAAEHDGVPYVPEWMTAEAEADEAVVQCETDRLAYWQAMDDEAAEAAARASVFDLDPEWLPWSEYRNADWVDGVPWDDEDEDA